MKNKFYIIIIGVAVVAIFFFIFKDTNKTTTAVENQKNSSEEKIQENIKADKVEVFTFHSTQRCVACVTMSNYAASTISEFFPSEMKEGKVEFKEINIDLPENKEIAKKFQARGSSLFINAIYNEQDHIKEDVTVWRLLNNQSQFENYLKNKINNLLAK